MSEHRSTQSSEVSAAEPPIEKASSEPQPRKQNHKTISRDTVSQNRLRMTRKRRQNQGRTVYPNTTRQMILSAVRGPRGRKGGAGGTKSTSPTRRTGYFPSRNIQRVPASDRKTSTSSAHDRLPHTLLLVNAGGCSSRETKKNANLLKQTLMTDCGSIPT